MGHLLKTFFFFFSSRRRHTRFDCDWSSDVCSSDLLHGPPGELGDPNEAVGELLRDAGRAHGCGAEVVGGPELPLAGVGEDGPGALGPATEVDLRDWQPAGPHEAHVELRPADVLLDG